MWKYICFGYGYKGIIFNKLVGLNLCGVCVKDGKLGRLELIVFF